MRLIIAGAGRYGWFAPAWARALTLLGMRVSFFDYDEYWAEGLFARLENRFLVGPSVSRLNRELLRMAKAESPDLILVHNGYPVFPETIKELANCWPVAGFHHDNVFGAFGKKAFFRHFRAALSHYSFHHVIRARNIVEYESAGVENVRLLMTYYVPWIHRPLPSGRGADVVFVGHAEPDARISLIAALIEAGSSIKICGSERDWRRHLSGRVLALLPRIQPVLNDDYAAELSAARVSLAFYSTANLDSYSYRVFEIPACGGFLLGQRTDAVQEIFEEGREAEFFDSEEELIAKVRYYIRNGSARDEIARRGYERCTKSGYDVVSRMKTWISDVREFVDARI